MARPELRAFEPSTDSALVMSSWAHQVQGRGALAELSPAEYHRLHRPVVLGLLQRVAPLVACSPHDPAIIYGWLCGELLAEGQQVLHMIYTRSAYRRQGVASALLQVTYPELGRAPLYYTHETRATRYHRDRWQLRAAPHLAQVM